MVEEILKAEKGNLNLSLKGAFVKLLKKVLTSVLDGEADEVSLSLKTSKVKTAPKTLKNKTLVSKKVYGLKLMVGKETISDYDLQGAKFQVKLSIKLEKAPKNLYVLNVNTGKLIKASYQKGKLCLRQMKRVNSQL